MIEYVLLAMMVSTTTVNDVTTQSVKWSPTPISVHATYKECEHAYNDLSGFPRRPDDTGWPRHNSILKCIKVKSK
jgi:hypothetical protein